MPPKCLFRVILQNNRHKFEKKNSEIDHLSQPSQHCILFITIEGPAPVKDFE